MNKPPVVPAPQLPAPAAEPIIPAESSRPVAVAKPVEKLAYNLGELCAALGVSYATIHRLEKKGLLRPIPHIRHRLYPKVEVERFLAGKTAVA